ncbi:MAG TPA: lactate utilization protein [Abditibacteriaceae bacterium]|jgi:L-lactate dehydrogenase complex protein LldG
MRETTGGQFGARDALLQKIRRALQVPAPHPGKPHGASHQGVKPNESVEAGAVSRGEEPAQSGLHAPIKAGSEKVEGEATTKTNVLQTLTVFQSDSEWKQWLPPTGENWDDWSKLFATNAASLSAEFYLLDSVEELPAALQKLATESSWTNVAFHDDELVTDAAQSLGLPLVETKRGYDRDALMACEAGISSCDALVAQTGSVLLNARRSGGRALSVLVPHHVVIARREQLVPDLPTAFALLHGVYGETWPSLITFITGPSRTGDIERILVLGAHGPKRLTIFVV